MIWLISLGLHVLVYFKRAFNRTAEDLVPRGLTPVGGTTARAYALAAVVIVGLVVAGATIPAQHRWIDLPHGHHRGLPLSPRHAMWQVRERRVRL